MTCFLGPSGLSRVGQEYFKFFSKSGFRVVPVWLMPPEMDVKGSLNQALADSMLEAAGRPLDPSPIQIHCGRADGVRVVRGCEASLGSMVVEGNLLTPQQVGAAMACSAVLAPSRFCAKTCLGSGLPRRRVHEFPYPLDGGEWHPGVAPMARPPGGAFRFLYMNTWHERKGYDLLLRAWWQEFSAADHVELVIKSYRENDRRDPIETHVAVLAERMGVDRGRKAPIRIMDNLMNADDIPPFMASFDALVSPHRSEGFGLSPWHALALGVPVVCTDYGGVTDFCKADTAWLVRVDGMVAPSEYEAGTFVHLGKIVWAEPDMEDLRRQMRMAYTWPAEGRARALRGARFVSERYSYEALMPRFQDILGKVAPGAWEKLCLTRGVEWLTMQKAERFESVGKPLRLVEI